MNISVFFSFLFHIWSEEHTSEEGAFSHDALKRFSGER